jgi:hypothetical protein
LNSDDQQFYQYQQNEQSPLTSTHRTQKRPRHMTLEIQVLICDRNKNVAGLNHVMESQNSSSLNINNTCDSAYSEQ